MVEVVAGLKGRSTGLLPIPYGCGRLEEAPAIATAAAA